MIRVALSGGTLRWLLFLIALTLASCAPHAAPTVMDGDIIFQTSKSSQSLAIQRATGSRYSHMGLIFLRAGKPFVFEAVSPVKYTPLDQWIARREWALRGQAAEKRSDAADPRCASTAKPRCG